MIESQVVGFSGDSATATMDIQIGKGPYSSSVSGLVQIGETLTMVVYIEGDAGFDVHVRDCIAHDGNRDNAITLTDNRGCVLKKKLMGPWQKTREINGFRYLCEKKLQNNVILTNVVAHTDARWRHRLRSSTHSR